MSGKTVTITGVSAGVATVTVTADDKHGGTATLSFEVTVKCPPAADGTIPDQSVYKKATATVTVTAEDDHGGEVDQEFDVTVTVPTPSISSISPPLQPPDTQVTISGSNFGSSQGSVSFGGDSVTDISSWSNTSIRCFIPVFASAGTVSVTVTTSGNKTSSGYSYTITGRSPVRGQCGDEEGCEGEEEPEKEGSGSEEGGDSEGSEDPPGDAG